MELEGYSVLGPLGAGGTAELFLAERRAHGGSRRRVALKRILPAFAQDPVFRNLFVHEARLAMQLGHRNIVQVYDFIESAGTMVLVMEFVDGCDLRTLLRNGPLPIPVALYVAVEVLRGLDYAHRKTSTDGQALEVVHRDVAPGNILLSREGEVKLADFGLARSREQLQKSHTGVKGTFAFMAPEQAEGRSIDARADLFATGALTYAMLTGHSPFDAEGPLATLEKVRRADFAPLGNELDPILARALQANPDRRYRNAAEMQNALEELAHEKRQRLDPAPLGKLVTAAAPIKYKLPGPLSATLPTTPVTPAPHEVESGPAGEPAHHTKVLASRPKKSSLALPLGAGGALAVAAAMFFWPMRPQPIVLPVVAPSPSLVLVAPSPPVAVVASPKPIEKVELAPPRPRAKPGYLTVSADPWAYVFIDGRKRGTTPLTDLELSPGTHEVMLENPPLGASQTKKVQIAAGEHRTVIEKMTGEH